MLVNIAQTGNNTVAPSLSGWTLVNGISLAGVTLRYGAVLYKVAGASEGAGYTFTLGTGVSSAVGGIVAFSGVDTTGTPFDVTPGAISVQASGTAVAATAITTTSANAAVIMFGMAAASAPTWSAWTTTSPGSLTQLFNSQGATTSVGAAWGTKTAAGTTGAGAATLSAAERNGGILIALKANVGATQLAFTSQPASTNAGSVMANVVVQIQNAVGTSVASNNVPVTVTLSSGTFASGTLTVNSDSTG